MIRKKVMMVLMGALAHGSGAIASDKVVDGFTFDCRDTTSLCWVKHVPEEAKNSGSALQSNQDHLSKGIISITDCSQSGAWQFEFGCDANYDAVVYVKDRKIQVNNFDVGLRAAVAFMRHFKDKKNWHQIAYFSVPFAFHKYHVKEKMREHSIPILLQVLNSGIDVQFDNHLRSKGFAVYDFIEDHAATHFVAELVVKSANGTQKDIEKVRGFVDWITKLHKYDLSLAYNRFKEFMQQAQQSRASLVEIIDSVQNQTIRDFNKARFWYFGKFAILSLFASPILYCVLIKTLRFCASC